MVECFKAVKQERLSAGKRADMTKISHSIPVITLAVSLLFPVATLSAQGTASPCQNQCKKCYARDADLCCRWTEETRANKLVRGRAGQLEWVLFPATVVHTHKCADSEHTGKRESN
jgi:hypothetical protein